MLRGWSYRGPECRNDRRRCRRPTNRSGWAHSLRPALEPLESLALPSLSAPVALDLGLASARVAVADANGDGLPAFLAADGKRTAAFTREGGWTCGRRTGAV